MISKKLIAACMPCATIALQACVGDSHGDPTIEESSKPTFERTAVHLNPDGTQTISKTSVTRDEQLAEQTTQRTRTASSSSSLKGLGVARAAIGTDSYCEGSDGSDIILYDQTGGTGNEICFWGNGQAELGNYSRGGGNWSEAVRGYLPGDTADGDRGQNGYLGTLPYPVYFAANQALTNAGTDAQTAQFVQLAITGCASWVFLGDAFPNLMVGCGGSVSFANRATLCASGYHVCSATEWNTNRGTDAPTSDYWTNDNLGWSGNSGACEATSNGVTSCGTTPMRVCYSTSNDGGATSAIGPAAA